MPTNYTVPPPFSTTARRPPPPQTNPSPHESSRLNDLINCTFLICGLLIFLCLGTLLFLFVCLLCVGARPLVQIGYVTVSFHNDSTNPDPNMLTSEWYIDFTVENQKIDTTLVYHYFNVSVNQRESTVGIVPGFRQASSSSDNPKAVHCNTTVRALVPRVNATVYELPFSVTFLSEVNELSFATKVLRMRNKSVMFSGTCSNMKVRVQGTHGIMGGPFMCLDPNQGSNKYGDIF